MIEFVVKTYPNERTMLVVREWNGADRPEYSRVLELFHNEWEYIENTSLNLELKKLKRGGRFKRYIRGPYVTSGNTVLSTSSNKILPYHVTINQKPLSEVIPLIAKTTSGYWNIELKESYFPDSYIVHFELEEDGVLLKMYA